MLATDYKGLKINETGNNKKYCILKIVEQLCKQSLFNLHTVISVTKEVNHVV